MFLLKYTNFSHQLQGNYGSEDGKGILRMGDSAGRRHSCVYFKRGTIPSRKQTFCHALDTRVQPVVNTLEGTERDNYQAAASTRPRKRRAVSYATL